MGSLHRAHWRYITIFWYSSLLKETNRCAKYLFVKSVRSYLKINFSSFCSPKHVAKFMNLPNCDVSCSDITYCDEYVMSSAGNVFKDNIHTHVINKKLCITQNLYLKSKIHCLIIPKFLLMIHLESTKPEVTLCTIDDLYHKIRGWNPENMY